MSRKLYPVPNLVPTVLPITQGGTDADTAPQALFNLHGIALIDINQPDGVLGLTAGIADPANLPTLSGGSSNSVNISGLETPMDIYTSRDFIITNFDIDTVYTLTAISGTVTRVDNTITYTASTPAANYGFIINGRSINVSVILSTVLKPIIVSPVISGIIKTTTLYFTSSSFLTSSGSDTHHGSDWQLSTTSDFTSIVNSVIDSAADKQQYTTIELVDNTTYYVRVRYKGTLYGYSQWSDTVTFTKGLSLPHTEVALKYPNEYTVTNYMGYSVAIDATGTRIVAGAYGASLGGLINNGAVFVFVKSENTWIQEATLSVTGVPTNYDLGWAVSIDANGDRIIASADESYINGTGSVRIFKRTGTSWAEEALLTVTGTYNFRQFGCSVDINSTGDRAVIGACSDRGLSDYTGTAYIFSRSGTIWTQEAKIYASDRF